MARPQIQARGKNNSTENNLIIKTKRDRAYTLGHVLPAPPFAPFLVDE